MDSQKVVDKMDRWIEKAFVILFWPFEQLRSRIGKIRWLPHSPF